MDISQNQIFQNNHSSDYTMHEVIASIHIINAFLSLYTILFALFNKSKWLLKINFFFKKPI